MFSDPVAVSVLEPQQVDQVRVLHDEARAADGVAALSEQALLHLASGASPAVHLLTYAEGDLAGYAQLPGGPGDGSAELVVGLGWRREGVGSGLLDAVLQQVGAGARLWAHGNLPSARAFASARHLEPVRELHKMTRPLSASDADSEASAPLPQGFSARPFLPGRDEDAWLAANAAAFAHHPEQGRMTRADLEDRMAQEWFDPGGFILVEADASPGEVAAFHWTKVDREQRATADPAATAGEVYVLGVHPAHQGRGLARPVTALGLAHLARLGLPEVVLYVDGDNRAALRTYESMGFRSIMVDVMYAPTAQPTLSG